METNLHPRVVVCAAIRNKAGKIVCGARHWDSVMRGQVMKRGWLRKFIGLSPRPRNWFSAEQGFIDQFCVFMDRQEAWKVAEAAGQIKYPLGHSEGTLYSENLY